MQGIKLQKFLSFKCRTQRKLKISSNLIILDRLSLGEAVATKALQHLQSAAQVFSRNQIRREELSELSGAMSERLP